MSYKPLVPGSWPTLVFDEGAQEVLRKIDEFFIERESDPRLPAWRKSLEENLDYLAKYGRDENGASRFQVRLGRDWAQFSFSLYWAIARDNQPTQHTGQDWFDKPGWPGGLIWHGGPNDPLTVSIKPDWWQVHT